MSNARNLARLLPNASGQLPDANLAAIAAGKVSGQLADSNMSSGSVLQVQQGTQISQIESSAGLGVDVNLNLTVSITPSSVSNKIMVTLGSLSMVTRDNATVAKLYLERSINGGAFTKITGIQNYVGQDGMTEVQPTCNYLDSPNTTTQVTYRVIGQRYSGGANIAYIHNNSDPVRLTATITAMEIAA